MKSLIILCSLLLGINAFAADIYCEDDTGEALSEVYDADDTVAQFEIVGLNSKNYSLLVKGFGVKEWKGLDIWEIAELEQKHLPEIHDALAAWVSDACPTTSKK